LNVPKRFLVLRLTVTVEAITAINGAIAARLEGHLRGYAAAIANHFVHLPLTAAGVLRCTTSRAAGGATAGLILKAFVSKELLLAGREHEFLTAIPTG